MSIGENIKHIQKLKEDAAKRAGRSGEEVLLVAVTKLHSADEINEAIDCGITDIGENKVQEIMDKYEKVKPVRWHLIGHLQTNKVKYIIDKVAMIHSVDSLHLAKEIDKRARQHGLVMDILIQVNSAMEESKFGITTEETGKMIDDICLLYTSRLVFRVGRYPLILNETSVSSGVTPTHFLGYSCFEWGNTPLVLQDIFTLSGLISQQSAKKLQKFDIIYILQRE